MYVATVIPLSKSVRKGELTYFTAEPVASGMIVAVPVRKKIVNGIVVSVAPVAESKMTIKSSDFDLRKIKSVRGQSFFDKAFWGACALTQKYFVADLGAVIDSVVPNTLLENCDEFTAATETKSKSKGLVQEKLVFQAPIEDRITFYKTFIRESFARKMSVFIMLPTLHDFATFESELERGIEPYSFTLHGDLTKKELLKRAHAIAKETHPVLIIGTPMFLSLPRADLGTIIVERESSNAYRMQNYPSLDMRVFAEFYSAKRGVKIVLADTLLRVETGKRADDREFGEVAPRVFRLGENVPEKIVMLKDDAKDDASALKARGKKRPFIALREDIRGILELLRANTKGHILLFTLRNSLSPIVKCNDCDTMLTCEYCRGPLSLYSEPGERKRIFICRICKKHTPADATCAHCGSWNLVGLGIGTDFVRDELARDFPDLPVFQIDRTSIKNAKEGFARIKQFYETPKAILLGTEMALFYLHGKIDYTGIVSFDSLFNIPSFRINERILDLIILLRGKTEKEMIIQTRHAEGGLFLATAHGSLHEWYRSELAEREQFSYPPYSTIVKVSRVVTADNLSKEKSALMELFGDYHPDIFKSRTPSPRGNPVLRMVLRIPKNLWSTKRLLAEGTCDPELEEKLRAIPREYRIEIDPEDLL